MPRYTIRYRFDLRGGRTALLVDDAAGRAHLFAGGRLQRVPRRLAGRAGWTPVPAVAPYTLDELRRLTAPSPGGAPARRPAAAS